MATAVTDVHDLTPGPRVDFKRTSSGNPLVTPPPGWTGRVGNDGHVMYGRPSSAGKVLEDTYHLEKWQQRQVAVGVASRPEFVALASSLDPANPEDKAALDDLVERAKEAARSSAGADMGSALHALTARIDAGDDIDIPDYAADAIAEYRATIAAHGIEIVRPFIEVKVVNDDARMAGTADRFVVWRSRLVVLDLKCGSGIWLPPLNYAAQLAVYARSSLYNPDTGQRSPITWQGMTVDTTVGLLCHLPAAGGPCTLYEVDLERAWHLLGLAEEVRSVRRKDYPLASPLTPVADDDTRTRYRAELNRRIDTIRQHRPHLLAELAARWPAGVPTLKQSDGHTVEQLDAIRGVVDAVETLDGGTGDVAELRATAERLMAHARDHQPDRLGDIARAWPAGVPTLKQSTGHTRDQLEAILKVLEEYVDEPFDPTPEDLAALDARRARIADLRGRLRALPQDLLDGVTVTAERAGIPSLSSPACRDEHVARIEQLYEDARVEADGRFERLAEACEGDAELVAAAAAVAGAPAAERMTGQHLRVALGVVAAVDAGLLVMTFTEQDGARLDPAADAVDRLVELHGSKSALLGAAKGAATTAGVKPPKSSAEVGASPVLIALAAERPTQQGDTTTP